MYEIRTQHKHPDGKIFAWVALILGFGLSLTYPIFPNFVTQILESEKSTSIFYAIMAGVMLVSAISSTIIFPKVERTKIVKISLLSIGIVFFSLILVTELFGLGVFATIRFWFEMFLIISLALFVRDFAGINTLGKAEGLYFKFANIGYLAGPIIGGFLAVSMGYEMVFVLASTVLLFGLAYLYHAHLIQNHPAIINQRKVNATKFFQNIKLYFLDRDRAKAYLINFTSVFWSAIKYLYVPMYILREGYLESISGIILALTILPSILIEVKVGDYADKHGIKKPVALGFFIMAACLLAVFFSPLPLVNFLLLAAVGFGKGLVEPLHEYYLFHHLPSENEDALYGIYMTASPMAYIIAPAIGAVTLTFLPFKFIFLVFGIFMLAISLFSWAKLPRS